MPVWLSENEYATLKAACAQMMPSYQGAVGADEAGVADYIDIFLGAFSFDPPRIWAGGPSSGRHGGEAGFADFIPLPRLDQLAWRIRLEGSQGLPEREFNGPVIGLQERYRAGHMSEPALTHRWAMIAEASDSTRSPSTRVGAFWLGFSAV